ncbi:MAG: EndoU domain-containing protein [Deltaproteobacteria bacterium]|nr:EndoU domain-containing protein [Deltaproteobacteria bacterium]
MLIFKRTLLLISFLLMTCLITISGYSSDDYNFSSTNHGKRDENGSSGGRFGETVWSSESHQRAKESWRAEIERVKDQAERDAVADIPYVPRVPEVKPYTQEELEAEVNKHPVIRNFDAAIVKIYSFKDRRDQIKQQILDMDSYETRRETVEEATEWAKSSREYYKQQEFEAGDIAITVAETLLDIAVSVTPVVGWARDCYESILGKDLLSGKALDNTERILAVAGALTGGFGSKIGKAAKVFQKTMKIEHGSETIITATKIIDSAKKWDSVQSLIHVAKGNYQIASDGTRKIVSGMHTKLGFDNFLKLNEQAGKSFNIKNVTEFTSESINAGGEVLSQTLGNGVRRLQLPRDAWVNGKTYNKAVAYSESEQKLKGIKSLFPDGWNVSKIGHATNSVKNSSTSIRSGNSITGTYENVKIQIFVDGNDKILTSFPAWKQ